MKVQRVEKHIIKKTDSDFSFLDDLCFKSKNLYNYVLYILRQAFTGNHELITEYKDLIEKDKYISEYKLSSRLSKLQQIDYKELKAQSSQQVIKLLYKNFKSFSKALKAYIKEPTKFLGRPKLPKYKDKNGRNIVIFTNQNSKIKNNEIFLSKFKKLKIKSKVNDYQQIRITHKSYYIVIEIVYEKEINQKEINQRNNNIAIDLGVNNLASITSDNNLSLIINGRNIKSINQYYNKEISKLQEIYSKQDISKGSKLQRLNLKRTNKIEDYFHKMSKFVKDLCLQHNVCQCFIGLNKGWKDSVNLGKKNNQKFVQIPFFKFINMLSYKLKEVGCEVVTINESYTSKCSFIDNEEVKKHTEYKGKRIKRGLFKSALGKVINADINASLNILRKGIKQSSFKNSNMFNPIKIKDNKMNPMSLNILDNRLEAMCYSH